MAVLSLRPLVLSPVLGADLEAVLLHGKASFPPGRVDGVRQLWPVHTRIWGLPGPERRVPDPQCLYQRCALILTSWKDTGLLLCFSMLALSSEPPAKEAASRVLGRENTDMGSSSHSAATGPCDRGSEGTPLPWPQLPCLQTGVVPPSPPSPGHNPRQVLNRAPGTQ